jgi:hypothetical protein
MSHDLIEAAGFKTDADLTQANSDNHAVVPDIPHTRQVWFIYLENNDSVQAGESMRRVTKKY